MVKLVSQDGSATLTFNAKELEKDSGYSSSIGFDLNFQNDIVSTVVGNLWFYLDDIKKFYELTKEAKTPKEIRLGAMSEFLMTINKADELGHLKANLLLEDFTSETTVSASFETNIPDLALFAESLVAHCMDFSSRKNS